MQLDTLKVMKVNKMKVVGCGWILLLSRPVPLSSMMRQMKNGGGREIVLVWGLAVGNGALV
jgi:hypothetical protein